MRMKWLACIITLLSGLFVKSQITFYKDYAACKTSDCKIEKSFVNAEYYLDNNDINVSQKWLEKTRDAFPARQIDATACAIHSLQSELFYYMGLFQFGAHEAKTGMQKAKSIKDSLLIADSYFFIGINSFELQQYNASAKALWMSRNYFPFDQANKKRLRTTIRKEHIYNNLAQLKLKMNQPDSAIWYNSRAYQLAKKAESPRGIPNVEQTFGEIFLNQKKFDSASIYFQRSSESAIKSKYYDIVMLNYAFLMKCAQNNKSEVERLFRKGTDVMKHHMINAIYQRYFYRYALDAFMAIGDFDSALLVQGKIIKNDEETRIKGNSFLQDITNQYVKNENKLLSLKILELNRQKNITILQLIAALLCVLILGLVVLIFRRKSKLQQTLLDQKNEISKDLHDDIGSGLSSILIHADLLAKSNPNNEKQNILATKIASTGKEISQRLNTFIWSLSNENDSLQRFCEYVKHYADALFEATDTTFLFEENFSQSSQKALDGQIRKNLFFCIKEILNNALKHSGATVVTMQITAEKNEIQILVRDNGNGFHEHNHFGNGLKNIQKRIEGINGKLSIVNDNGLVVSLSIPF